MLLTQLALFIADTVFGFFSILLLGRFLMQWLRVSFRNQVGAFVVAATDWAVLPVRRFMPGMFGLDWASLILAILVQTLLVLVTFLLRGLWFGGAPIAVALVVLLLGLLEALKLAIYLLVGIVIVAAILSWVNPYSPLAPLFNALVRPFLRPFQRMIPPVANVDLSPLVLLLVLQVILFLLASVRANAVALVV